MNSRTRDTSGPRVYPRIYCCCNGCINSSIKRPELSFFKLPRDQERRYEWLRLISREDLYDKKAKSYVVCEEHFHAHEILRAEHRKNLKKNAVPSINLPNMQNQQVVAFDIVLRIETATQTDEKTSKLPDKSIDSSRMYNPLKRKLKCKKKTTKRNKLEKNGEQSDKLQLQTFHKLCENFLTGEFAELVKIHSLSRKNTKQPLLSITTDIDEKAISILRIKVQNMTDEEKNCCVIIDMLDLKANLVYNTKKDRIIGFHEVDGVQSPEPATAALVLTLRGLVIDWKQPLGFALLSEYRNYEEITKWIDNLLGKLFNIGLNIMTFISDTNADLYNLAKQRSISPEVPFFIVRNKKIFYIFDAADLIRLARDSFIINEFNFQGRVANFEAIKEFYNQDRVKECKLAPKLTESHINPNNIEKKDLRLAVQLFSYSVSAAISTYIDFFVIDESAKDTVKVIILMNHLFDLFNSEKIKHDNIYKKVFMGEAAQIQLLEEALTFFKNLKLVDPRSGQDVTTDAKFIEGFQISINSTMLMLEELKKKDITFIRTRWLRRDCTEKLFSEINSMTDKGNTSCHQFMSRFSEQLIADIMKPPSTKDCSLQIATELLKNSRELQQTDGEHSLTSEIDTISDESYNNARVKRSDYNYIETPSENAIVYSSSCLLKRCSEKHKDCDILKTYIKPEQRIQSFGADVRYQRYREYSRRSTSSLLVVPRDDFIRYVERMEQQFRDSFKRKHVHRDIAASIYKEMTQLEVPLPCPCFPVVYLKKLFIRMRLYHTIHFNNRKFRAARTKRKYFTLPSL